MWWCSPVRWHHDSCICCCRYRCAVYTSSFLRIIGTSKLAVRRCPPPWSAAVKPFLVSTRWHSGDLIAADHHTIKKVIAPHAVTTVTKIPAVSDKHHHTSKPGISWHTARDIRHSLLPFPASGGWLSFRFWRSWEVEIVEISHLQIINSAIALVSHLLVVTCTNTSGFCSDRTELLLDVMAGEFWIQLFGSCVAEQEPTPRRPRIDRSQIGQPMNFRHTGHVGSTDLGSISTLQTQMKGKGGEPVHIQVYHRPSPPFWPSL